MPELDSTLGAAFIGTLVAAVLYGITTLQTFMYFHDFKDDGIRIKSIVVVLWILDTIHLVLTGVGMYTYLVKDFGDFVALLSPTWTILAQVYLTILSDFIVRWSFARRVNVLCTRKRVLGNSLQIIILVLSLVVFAFGFGFASRSFALGTYAKMNEAASMLYVSLSSGVAADSVIATSLCTLLLKSRTGVQKTDSIVMTLITFSINTGLLTSICAIACLVTYAIWPERFIFLGIYFALSKLHINSLLASLNARTALRDKAYGLRRISRVSGLSAALATKDFKITAETYTAGTKIDHCDLTPGV